MSNILPTSLSFHLPRNISPRKGFRGFLIPKSSLPPAYCCRFNDVRYHFSTKRALFSAFDSSAGATKICGNSAHEAGYSTADRSARMKGGAVMEERSPLIVEMDAIKSLNAERLLFTPLDIFILSARLSLIFAWDEYVTPVGLDVVQSVGVIGIACASYAGPHLKSILF
jgi:hypothetical protein